MAKCRPDSGFESGLELLYKIKCRVDPPQPDLLLPSSIRRSNYRFACWIGEIKSNHTSGFAGFN